MFEHDAEIVFNKKIAPHTYLIGLSSSEVVAAARPGQFVMLRVRSGIAPLLRRPFSIAGTKEGKLLLILYRVVGKGTAIMAETRDVRGSHCSAHSVRGSSCQGAIKPPFWLPVA